MGGTSSHRPLPPSVRPLVPLDHYQGPPGIAPTHEGRWQYYGIKLLSQGEKLFGLPVEDSSKCSKLIDLGSQLQHIAQVS